MAIQPPPAPANTPVPPATAKPRSCCGCGCGGCLLAVVLVVLLVGGSGYYFFIVQAQAAVAAPAALVVISTPVDVGTNDSNYKSGISGQQLTAGSSVRTGHGGHAAVQFPDGSYVRMAPDTTLTVTSAKLAKNGTLQSASLTQKIGRTFSTVQHLASGSTFEVAGHSVSAQVRGTDFEVFVRSIGTLIKVFSGIVAAIGATTVSLNAGEQVAAAPDGKLGNKQPIQNDPLDPFALEYQSRKAADTNNNGGTAQTTSEDNLTTGQSAQLSYDSPGGTLTAVLSYPGSLMALTVTDPSGVAHQAQGPPPLVVKVPNGAAGHYTATVHGVSLPAAGEAFSVTFETDAACVPGNIDAGGVVRNTISNGEISQSLQESGVTGITLEIQGTSPSSARIYYSQDVSGQPLVWTIDFYAATPNLGVVITQVSIRGFNLTTQVISRLTSIFGQSISAIPSDYSIDRVYSCHGAAGTIMVIEGHR